METVLITGASRGIGRETAKLFSKNGFNVVINYNKSEKDALELLSEIKNAAAIRADVSNRKEVFEMVEKANSIFGGIDILVNNAAVAGQMLFQDISEEEWDRIFDTNVKGAFNCTQAVLSNMLNKKNGKIINISSIWGITGASCEVHYSASKAALIGFTKALAKELGPSGITVNCIAPGVINTDMNSNIPKEVMDALKEETPLRKIGSPEDIANTIFFLASKKADFITGQVISPNGGFLI